MPLTTWRALETTPFQGWYRNSLVASTQTPLIITGLVPRPMVGLENPPPPGRGRLARFARHSRDRETRSLRVATLQLVCKEIIPLDIGGSSIAWEATITLTSNCRLFRSELGTRAINPG
jgi:hypothetical protein